MKKLSFISIIRKQQPKSVFIEAIWKSWYRDLSISIAIGNGIVKKKQFFLALSYGVSTTLLQLRFAISYSSSQRRPLVFQKKTSGTLGSSRPGVLKKQLLQKCILSSETSKVEFFLSTLVGLPVITPKSFQSSYSADTGLSEQFRCPLFGTKNSIFQMSFETESSCIHFCLLYYSNFLAAKCKRYLHFSYMQFIDCLQIHGITQITYLNIQEASNK